MGLDSVAVIMDIEDRFGIEILLTGINRRGAEDAERLRVGSCGDRHMVALSIQLSVSGSHRALDSRLRGNNDGWPSASSAPLR